MSNSLRPHGLYSPWNSLGQNTGVGNLSLLQGIFPTQGSSTGLPHCRWILYQLNHREAQNFKIVVIIFYFNTFKVSFYFCLISMFYSEHSFPSNCFSFEDNCFSSLFLYLLIIFDCEFYYAGPT